MRSETALIPKISQNSLENRKCAFLINKIQSIYIIFRGSVFLRKVKSGKKQNLTRTCRYLSSNSKFEYICFDKF